MLLLMNTPNSLHGITEAARAVGCAENTLRNLAARGVIKPLRLADGRCARYVFSQADIRAARKHLARGRRKE